SFKPLARLFLSFALIGFVAHLALVATPSVSWAQEPEKKGDDGEKKTEKEEEPLVSHFLKSIGIWFGSLFLVLSIGTVMLVVFLLMDLRMGDAVSPAFVEDFTNMVNRKQFKQAYDLCKTDTSFLAQVMTAGMGRLQYGIEDAREAMFNQVDTVKASKEQLVS